MKKICQFIAVICSLIVVVSCSSVRVIQAEKSDRVNLSDYKTYGFYKMNINNETTLQPQKESLELILTEIKSKMGTRNYQKSENPELLINIGIVLTEELQTRETSIRDAPIYMGTRNYHWESEEVVVGTYNEGSVAIDFVDTKTDSLVYHAVAKSILSRKVEKNQAKIKDAVEQIFDKISF